jgi:hypothetical protein
MVSKELFKDDNKDILVIQDQIKNMEECLLNDKNIASAVQWRRHGEDRGGHVPPSSLQVQFSNLSKSGEKNGGRVRL